ncbi:MAG: hypothetical protein AAF723_00605 [Pseudomonadota bacterium]
MNDMTATSPSLLSKLAKGPLRVPAYLTPATEKFTGLAEQLALTIRDFLCCEITAQPVDIMRIPSALPQAEGATVLDFHPLEEGPSLRMTLEDTPMTLVANTLFNSEVDEPGLRASVAQTFANRLAEVLLSADPDCIAVPYLVAAKQKPLSDHPVLMAKYSFEIEEKGQFHIAIEASRSFTDIFSPPCPSLKALQLLDFPFTAYAQLGDETAPIEVIKNLKAGDVFQLPKARLEKVEIRALALGHDISLGVGEMGEENKIRSLRLNHVETAQEASKLRMMARAS